MFFRFLAFLCICVGSFDAFAQMLESDSRVKEKSIVNIEKKELQELKTQESQKEINGLSLKELTEATGSKDKKLVIEEKKEDEDIFIPEGELYRLNTPTLDGSVRGGQALVEVDEQGRMKKVEKIFLFYDNFKITNYKSSTGSCDARFNILSNLDRKISQIDVKLVWPGLTTTLSFSNVSPNTQTYYNYSLLGDGCYKMDMAPNIIVNRCRVKGMTASECASKIVWLSK